MRPFDVRGSVSAESPEPILGHLSLRGGILFPGRTVIGSKGLWDGKCSATPGAIPRDAFYCGRRPSLFKSGHDLSTSVHEAFE